MIFWTKLRSFFYMSRSWFFRLDWPLTHKWCVASCSTLLNAGLFYCSPLPMKRLFIQRCDGYVKNILLGAFNYAGVLLLGATYLLWEMRHVRKQVLTIVLSSLCVLYNYLWYIISAKLPMWFVFFIPPRFDFMFCAGFSVWKWDWVGTWKETR